LISERRVRNFRRALTKIAVLAIPMALVLGGSGLSAQDPPDKDADAVYEMGNGVTAPKPVYTPNPEYVDKARKHKINGVILLAMIVTAEGTVRDVKVTKSLDEDLDRQAVTAVSTWKFKPATKDGKPVAVHLKTQVTFRLY
jgi:TonB family protein